MPFRNLCETFGADITVSEMVASNPDLVDNEKGRLRVRTTNNKKLNVVQIVGSDPDSLAEFAKLQADQGADKIDINMGCPAKKVCKKQAGSFLLKDEKLVESILKKVVGSVDIPVTLKYRTGWDLSNINAVTIAKIAENCGIKGLALHGRTRACRFNGQAEYETIAKVVEAVSIPVFANGDIDSPEKAKEVLKKTDAAGIMVGRGALGHPWIFQEIHHFLKTRSKLPEPNLNEIMQTVLSHIAELHIFYGSKRGVRIARKHLKWYVQKFSGSEMFTRQFNQLTDPSAQLASAQDYFERLIDGEVMAA